MKVDRSNSINKLNSMGNSLNMEDSTLKDIKSPSKEDMDLPLADTYEKAKEDVSIAIYDLGILNKQAKEAENIYERVIDMIEELVLDYLDNIEDSRMFNISDWNPNEDLIAEEIVEYIIESSANENSKIEVLSEAVQEGFHKLINHLEESIDIVTSIYQRVIDRLNKQIFVNQVKARPEDIGNQLQGIIKDFIKEQIKSEEHLLELEGQKFPQMDRLRLRENIKFDKLSEEIVDLIKIAASENKRELRALIRLVDKSFLDIENQRGYLSEASIKAYDKIIKSLKEEIDLKAIHRFHIFPTPLGFTNWRQKTSRLRSRIYPILILLGLLLYYGIKALK